jgi:uncharacterized membrane protein YkoI
MKTKIFITLLALSFIVSLAGCGKNDKNGGNNMDSRKEYVSEEMLNNDLTDNSVNSSDTKISRDAAKKIALDEAGVTDNDIQDYEIELDKDFGKLVYEIEFNVNGTEHQYEVDANSGKITQRKTEID